MIEVSWSRCGGRDCIRLAAVDPGVDVRVRPAAAAALGAAPPMAGRLVHDGGDVCFLPRFGFVDGTAYTVAVGDIAVGDLVRRPPEHPARSGVLAIYPSGGEVPRNLLRCYVWFTAPMSEGYAAGHVRLVEDTGRVMAGALLAGEHELWDAGRRRLTVLLDPARIKRGLVPHRQAGYPLRAGAPFRLVVDDGFSDAGGAPLRAGAERHYRVGDDQRGLVEPEGWDLTVPPGHSTEPLRVGFDRPLDHGLLARCLHVVGPDRRPVGGVPEIGPEERSWRWLPRQPWAPGPHRIVVDPVLEDQAGNSITRVFDRDLARPEHRPRQPRPATLTFHPHWRDPHVNDGNAAGGTGLNMA